MKNLTSILLTANVLLGFSPGAALAAQAQDQQMLKLDPETRLEQRCNARAMGAVNRDHRNFRSDELVAYAFGDTVVRGNSIQAPGGAIRNGNSWYRLSYVCQTSSDGVDVRSFSYQLGEQIPRRDWDQHFLVPK
jgi:Domain of Unknown Function (DUF930)